MYPGVQDQVERLSTIYEQGRLPQFVILEGRPGLGKESIALQFALKICGETAGDEAAIGRHADIMVASDEARLKVHEANEWQEHLEIEPEGNKRRVLIIPNCERLTIAAANRMLKTFEEPPRHSMIILTTSVWGQLLRTIRSRVWRWRIRPPSVEALLEYFEKRHPGEPHLNELIQKCGYSPKKIEKSLRDQENSDFQFVENLYNLLMCKSWQEARKLVEQFNNVSDIAEVIRGVELARNRLLKQNQLSEWSFDRSQRVGEWIRRYRFVVVRQKIVMNVSNALDSLVLCLFVEPQFER